MAHSIYRSPKGEQAIKSKYNDLLRHWPIEKKSIYLDTGCGRTHVIACGDEKNPPLVLLHGNSHCSIRWLNEVETYCSSHRVYAIDIIGEPNHSDQERPKVRSQQYLNWLEEIFAKLNLREAALVGENMGAWVLPRAAELLSVDISLHTGTRTRPSHGVAPASQVLVADGVTHLGVEPLGVFHHLGRLLDAREQTRSDACQHGSAARGGLEIERAFDA